MSAETNAKTYRHYLAARMRDAANTIAEVNLIYGFHSAHGVWSPERLRHEASVVESDETL